MEDDQTKMTVILSGGALKERRRFRVTEFGASREYIVYNNSLKNARRALIARVLKYDNGHELLSLPQPERYVVREHLSPFTSVWRKFGFTSNPVSREEFVAMYTGSRRVRYEAALLTLLARPLTVNDAFLSAFVKGENTLRTEEKPDPLPRLIQPRSLRYNIELGRYLHHIEKRVYKLIDELFMRSTRNYEGQPHLCVAKGLNGLDQAEVLHQAFTRFVDPVAVGLDASKFDSHINTSLLKWEHGIYLGIFEDSPELKWLLGMQLHNVGFWNGPEGKIKYSCEGRRMSGDMNTALGNVLIMCAALYSYITTLGFSVSIVDNGDDAVAVMERGDAEAFLAGVPGFFFELGIRMKVEEPVDEFESVEFCNTRPVWNGTSWVMTRLIQKALHVDLTTTVQVPDFLAHLRAIGNCGLALCSGLPVMQDFYLWCCNHPRGKVSAEHLQVESCGLYHLSRNMEIKVSLITPEARLSFWKAFGMLPDLQIELESLIRDTRPCQREFEPTDSRVCLPPLFESIRCGLFGI